MKPLWRLTCRSVPVLLNDKVLQHTRVLAMHGCPDPAIGSLASPNHTAGLIEFTGLYCRNTQKRSNVLRNVVREKRDEGLLLKMLDLFYQHFGSIYQPCKIFDSSFSRQSFTINDDDKLHPNFHVCRTNLFMKEQKQYSNAVFLITLFIFLILGSYTWTPVSQV